MAVEEGSKVYIPSRPEDLKAIAQVIDDICNIKTMVKASNKTVTDQKKALAENYDLDPKAVSLMIKLREQEAAGSDSVAEDYFETQDEYHTMYQSLFKLNQQYAGAE